MVTLSAISLKDYNLKPIDLVIIVSFFLIVVGIGAWQSRKAGKSSEDFFLGGRSMPWWLLGISMVACTFSCDTPNLVTDIVRTKGVAGNWVWWAFLLTGMVTVFIYAKLWRRSEVTTDLEFYELRYSGKLAAGLRCFRAVYLGVFFNCIIMGSVTMAAIKIGQVMFGLSPLYSVVLASLGVVTYATLGGFSGSIWADLFQYSLAMVGAIWAAVVAVQDPQIGGLTKLFAAIPKEKLAIIPSTSDFWGVFVPVLVIPIAVQWWNVWYPGAEPGGGGYIAQRMLSAKNEKHAIGATLFFNFMHYAIRPWPWILVALASILLYPMDSQKAVDVAKKALKNNKAIIEKINSKKELTTEEIVKVTTLKSSVLSLSDSLRNPQTTYKTPSEIITAITQQKDQLTGVVEGVKRDEKIKQVDVQYLKHDLCYPMMMTKLPAGVFGLVIAGLLAAYMSTIATHLNWGSSYVVNDFYKRFIKPDSSEKHLVLVGRISTVTLMIGAGVVSLLMTNAKNSFDIMLQIGAGTGLIYILRWFWWRINSWSEITAMIVSFVIALAFFFMKKGNVIPEGHWLNESHWQLCIGILITSISWISVTFLTSPVDEKTLKNFVKKIRPGGPGWKHIEELVIADGGHVAQSNLAKKVLCVFLGCFAIWGSLFSIGYALQANLTYAIPFGLIAIISMFAIFKVWEVIISTDE